MSYPQYTSNEAIREIRDRSRRIESRLTALTQKLGFTTPAKRPVFNPDDGVVSVPSREVALDEVLAAIPPTWQGDVVVMIGENYICHIEVEKE